MDRRLWMRRGVEAGRALVVSLLYIGTIEFLAHLFQHDPEQKTNPRFVDELLGFVGKPETLPALCRWDAVWYVDIANGVYPRLTGRSPHNGAFFPLFGWLLRPVMKVFHLSAAYAAVWVSRVCLPFTVALLRDFVRLSRCSEEVGWAAVAALLFAPNGFILISGYAEGFFLLLTLLAAVLAKRGHPVWAAVPAFLAGLTRVHAFAFLVGLLFLGFVSAHQQRRLTDRLRAFAPAVGCGAALLFMMAYLQWAAHDPLLFVHQQAFFGKTTLDPLGVLRELPTYLQAFPPESVRDLYNWLRIPATVAIVGSILYFAVKRRPLELGYIAALYAMVLLSSHWGVVRYMVMVFPVCIALAALRRWPTLWLGYLLAGAMVQSVLLLQFVTLRIPSS